MPPSRVSPVAAPSSRSSSPSTESTLRHACKTLLQLVRNAVVSVAAAWGTATLCSLGSLAAPVAAQSYDAFLLSTLLYSQFFFCAIGTWLTAVSFTALRFRSRRSSSAATATATATPLWYCCLCIARHAWPFYVVAVALMVSITMGCAATKRCPLRAFKIEYYLGCLAQYVYLVGLGLVARFVFKRETVEGGQTTATRPRPSHSKRQPPEDPQLQPPSSTPRVRLLHRWPRVALAYLPFLLSFVAAVAYIQLLSAQVVDSELKLVALLVGNLLVKMLVQRVLKRSMLRVNIRHVRSMLLLVGFPTVLIDTQLRVILQRVPSVRLTFQGSVLLALLEIAVRVLKARLLSRQIARLDEQASALTDTPVVPVGARMPRPPSQGQLARTRRQLLAYRSAELYADMSAEYIAMGCAAALLVVYWDHPKYRLGALVASHIHTSGRAPALVVQRWNKQQTGALLVQFIMELAVDLVACVVEIAHGVTFFEVRKQGVYVALLFVATAVANVMVSAVIYLRFDD
ncbi:hypothetical protein PINS_up010229 [Pythium insidiosum]|nr:hypothetical protein PINS_up010229 [Pythium insidiosum]